MQIIDLLDIPSVVMMSLVNKYLRELCTKIDGPDSICRPRVKSADKIMRAAAGLGYLPIIEFLHNMGNRLEIPYMTAAVAGGQLETVKWLHSKGCVCVKDICNIAAHYNQFDILVYLFGIGNTDCDSVSLYAACHNSVQMLEWALATGARFECGDVCNFAAQSGSLDVLKCLHARFDITRYGDLCEEAARFGRLSTLKWIIEICGISRNGGRLMSHAVRSGDMPTIEYVYGIGGELSDLAYKWAVCIGRIDVLQWLIDRECPASNDSCHQAGLRSDVAMLEYLGENGLCTCKRAHSSARGHTKLVNRVKHRKRK